MKNKELKDKESSILDEIIIEGSSTFTEGVDTIGETVVEKEESVVTVDRKHLDKILGRPTFESQDKSGVVRADFGTTTKTIGCNLGELVNVVLPSALSVPEYQRDLRLVDDKEAESFHRTTFEYGQLNIVPMILVGIEGIFKSLKRKLNGLTLGSQPDVEELLNERIGRYERYLAKGYRNFIIDGQTRGELYIDWYSKDSDKPIQYGDNPPTTWEMQDENGDYSKFVINGMAFKDFTPRQQQGIWETLPCSLVIVETSSHEIPATTFSIANSGVPVSPTLIDMNCSFNGMRNQVEKLNLRKGSEEYNVHFMNGFKEYTDRFYPQTTNMFSEVAKGENAFEIMRSVHLFGDRMDNPVAQVLKGCVLFDESSGRGWKGVKKVVADSVVVWDAYTEKMMIETKTGKSLAIRELDQKNRQLKYCMSTKVNAVLFEENLLDSGLKIDQWKELYVDFFEYDRNEREETMYLLVTKEHAKTDDRYTKADVGKRRFLSPETSDPLKNRDGYHHWGTVQDSVKLIGYRKTHINKFVKANLNEWIEKGYIR